MIECYTDNIYIYTILKTLVYKTVFDVAVYTIVLVLLLCVPIVRTIAENFLASQEVLCSVEELVHINIIKRWQSILSSQVDHIY